MWSSISYVGRAQHLLPPAVLEYLSTGDELQLLSLGPNYFLPHSFTILFKSALKIPGCEIRQEEEIKGIHIEKEELKLYSQKT